MLAVAEINDIRHQGNKKALTNRSAGINRRPEVNAIVPVLPIPVESGPAPAAVPAGTSSTCISLYSERRGLSIGICKKRRFLFHICLFAHFLHFFIENFISCGIYFQIQLQDGGCPSGLFGKSMQNGYAGG